MKQYFASLQLHDAMAVLVADLKALGLWDASPGIRRWLEKLLTSALEEEIERLSRQVDGLMVLLKLTVVGLSWEETGQSPSSLKN